MYVDWPTIITVSKTILDPIAYAGWPIAIGGTVYGFRTPLAALIGRIREAKGFGGSVAFDAPSLIAHQQETNKAVSVPQNIGGNLVPGPDPVLDVLDAELITEIDLKIQGDDRLKLLWAVRVRSISEQNRRHETNYRVMFGSQIRALIALNQEVQSSVVPFEQFYAAVAADLSNAVIHKDRDFDQWGAFLVDVGYVEIIERTEPVQVRITAFGRSFCAWLGYAGASQVKPG